jgi:transcriptional regulator with XRE-family HTH domain
MSFGINVKSARTQKKLSLQELSERTGVSRSMLSKIEREEKNPTLQLACQIAEGLDLTLSELLGERKQEEVQVIRKNDRLVFREESSGFERHLLSPAFPSRGLEFILNVLPAGAATDTFPAHKQGVYEYITVAQGRLEITLGSVVQVLEPGDSLSFAGHVGHRFRNSGTEDCHYYLVIDSHHARS